MLEKIHETNAIAQIDLEEICRALSDADGDIRDIILFGSYVYAPSLARDVDLLITTNNRKDYQIYLDAVADFPVNVDIIVREPGERIGDDIARSIKALGQVLTGSGETLEEVTERYMLSFDQVRELFIIADESQRNAQEEENPFLKDRRYRNSFNELFDVARDAVMVYLASSETRWGQLRHALPKPFDNRFRQIIDTLHISYFYNGEYPKENPDKEYKRWRDVIERFVIDLERGLSR